MTWWKVAGQASGRRAEGHPGEDRGPWRAGALHKANKILMSLKTSPKTSTVGKII